MSKEKNKLKSSLSKINIHEENSVSSLNEAKGDSKKLKKSNSVHYFFHHSNQEVCYTIMQSLNLLINNDDILSTTNNNKLIRKSSQFFFNKAEKENDDDDDDDDEQEEEEKEEEKEEENINENNDHTEIVENEINNKHPVQIDNNYDKILKTINKYIESLENKGSKAFIYKKSHLYWSIYTTWEQIGECILDSAYLIQDNFIVSKEENINNEIKENNNNNNKMNSYKYRYTSRAGPCTSDTLCEYLTAFKNLYIMIRPQFKLENVQQLLTIITGLVLYNSLPEHPNSPTPHYIGDKEMMSNLQAKVINILQEIFLNVWEKNDKKINKRTTGRENEEGPLDLSKETIIKKQNLINKENESIIIEVVNVITVYAQLCFTSKFSLPNMNHKESIPYIQRMLIGTKHNKLIDNKIKSRILTKDVLTKQYPIPPQFSMITFSYHSLMLLSNAFNYIYYYPGIYSKNVYLNIFKTYQCYIEEKYNCPVIPKQESPLWKIAVNEFKDITKTGLAVIDIINTDLAVETIDMTYKILTNTINSYLNGVLQLNENMNLTDIECDEKFNIEFLKFITDDILSYYGSTYVKNEEFERLINNIGNNSKISYENDEFSKLPNSLRSSSQQTFPYSFGIYKEHEITLLGCENLPSFNEKFEMECLNTLFNLCQQNKEMKDNQNNDELQIKKQKIAEVTYPVLLLRCKKALMNYSYNLDFQNRCPLPRVKQEEIEFILNKLKTISVKPNLLQIDDIEENQTFKKELLLGSSSHLFYLYMPLCLSLKTNSEKVKMIIQDCLLRIGKEIGF